MGVKSVAKRWQATDIWQRTPESRERPFICNDCDAAFAHASGLTIHGRKHTGDRPYSCKYYDATFAYSNSKTLRDHLTKAVSAGPVVKTGRKLSVRPTSGKDGQKAVSKADDKDRQKVQHVYGAFVCRTDAAPLFISHE